MPNIEEHIRQAMQAGKFDDLPGKGKPLNLDENPHVDPDWRLAHHMLKSSGYTLPWIAARQEIEALIDDARSALRRAWGWHERALGGGQPAAQVEAEWRRAQRAFAEQVEKINQKIFDYNLQTPAEKFQLMKVNADREIEAVKDALG
jgi:DnaJ family protein C protein 28